MKLIPKKSFKLSLILLISCFSSIITDQITDPSLIRSSTITSVHLNNNNHTLSNQSILIRSIRDHHHLDVQSSSRENNHRKPFSFIERIKLDQDFKPKFRGQIIPGYRLNLTDLAKRIPNEPDYYDLDEFDDYDDIVDSEASDLSPKNISNQIDPKDSIDEITSSSMASSSLETTESSNISDSISISTSNDMDKTIGGFVGIIEKILLGPKSTEINETSSLEDVYAYLDQIVQEQFSKAFKSIIRRFYDNRLLFDQNLSQRCFNSFAQFGDRLRKNYQWPMKMLGASADFFSTRFSLRNYGDFDGCLSIDAEDEEHSPREIFFTGQYCLVQLLLPMPPVTKFLKLRIYEKIFDFDKISIDNRSTFVKNYLQNSPLFYSNPPSFGLCLPSVCSSNELEIAINQVLRKNHLGIRFTSDCYSRLNLSSKFIENFDAKPSLSYQQMETLQRFSFGVFFRNLTTAQWSALFLITFSGLMIVLSTINEIYHQRNDLNQNGWRSLKRDRAKSFLACFSIVHNIQQIFIVQQRQKNLGTFLSDDDDDDDDRVGGDRSDTPAIANSTESLDAIKTVTLIWICLANFYHFGYQTQMLGSIAHTRELLMSLRYDLLYQIVAQSWLSFEIFFLISGFLMAYTNLPWIAKQQGRPKLSLMILKRLLRFLPSLISLLLAVHLLPLWTNAGPLYRSSLEKILGPCRKYSWRNLFFLSNLFGSNETCLPELVWYLSNEFQLSMIGIMVLVFAFNRQKYSNWAFGTFIAIGLLGSGWIAYRWQLNFFEPLQERAILEELPSLIKGVHFNVIAHFSSYFSGLALGYLVRRRSLKMKFKSLQLTLHNRITITIMLLIISLSLIIYVPTILLSTSSKFLMENGRLVAIFLLSFGRLMFCFASIWIIILCLSSPKFITDIFRWSIFRLCSHLSLQIYLLNLPIVWLYLFTKRNLIETNLIESFPVAIGLILLTASVAFWTYLLFEAPYRNLFRYYFESQEIITSRNEQSNSHNNYSMKTFNSSASTPSSSSLHLTSVSRFKC